MLLLFCLQELEERSVKEVLKYLCPHTDYMQSYRDRGRELEERNAAPAEDASMLAPAKDVDAYARILHWGLEIRPAPQDAQDKS